MKIISIIGAEGSGKTKTLNMLYERVYNRISKDDVIQKREQVGSNKDDFSCVLSYKGKKIAFYSMGDYVNHLNEAFAGYSEFGCDYLICAIRDSILEKKTFKRPDNLEKHYLIKEEDMEEIIENILSSIDM